LELKIIKETLREKIDEMMKSKLKKKRKSNWKPKKSWLRRSNKIK
jgi:predicted ribosome quality control (RQC) complex YloA/Tae2 family protein